MIQVEGRNPVHETLKTTRPERILVAKGIEDQAKIAEILRLAKEQGTKVELVPKKRLDTLSQSGRHQGVIALIQPPKTATLKTILSQNQGDVTLILLDRLYDPMNLGSILRTAEATGVDAVVIPKKGSVGLTPAVLRASMGGGLHVPIIRDNLFQAIKLLKQEGVKLVGVDPTGSTDYYHERLTGPVALLMGGEDRGINPSLLDRCDHVVRIPMHGRITSLNVGAAAAVVLYERIRQLASP
ncbi:23S rRNA (guanosine(2251)-2'-O)-methyltransferase RlmB [Candidatus Bathyarchaeota archaeon]|nr:23S rRNA (guanosine(2251)-2'-O)-methyltransferase RlmB [Candidatus Bathyarchaeota archaeon]MBL7079514.1 23S rRNA (guanosine(2251)-2'-O)-methyltransferase RlmB [Candidatus Bathyarchaeota archaeon]